MLIAHEQQSAGQEPEPIASPKPVWLLLPSLAPFVLLLLSTLTFLHPAADAPWTFLRLASALVTVAILPGYFMLRLAGETREDSEPDFLERIPYCFGWSLILVVILFLAVISLHVNLNLAVGVVLLLSGALAVVVVWRLPSKELALPRGTVEPVPVLPLVLLLALTGYLLYWIGGLAGAIPNRAEGLDLAIIRKLAARARPGLLQSRGDGSPSDCRPTSSFSLWSPA